MPEIIPNWHPVFVHFTVALLSLSVGLFVITHFLTTSLKEQWITVARWCLWFGMGFTLFTVASGIYAYNTVDHDTPSHLAMTDHRNWAVITSLAFLLLSMWSLTWAKQETNLSIVFVLGMVLAGALLASTAWRGGELVYRHGLGVISLPQNSGEGHAHEHGDVHDHGDDHAGHGSSEPPQAADTSTVEAKPLQADEMSMDFSGMEEGMGEVAGQDAHAQHNHDHDHQH